MKKMLVSLVLLTSFGSLAPFEMAFAAEVIDAKAQAILDKKIESCKQLAAKPNLVKAVKAANASPSADAKAMTQAKWDTATIMEPFLSGLAKNEAAVELRQFRDQDNAVSEAFVSAADGTKVAYLSKSSSWIHKGKPKHDKPMSGQVWQGDVEVDASTGMKQVQVAVPVMDGGKAIGSLVVGLKINNLK